MFETLDEAAKALLISTREALNGADVQYLIVGGWVPVLRGGASELQHPGTRDVDVLFNDDISAVRSSFERLLNAGFIPSAKHEFQLLRQLTVGGLHFVYNVDLLHPGEEGNDRVEFNKIFDFGIPDSSDATGRHWAKSIIFPAAKVIFDRNMYSKFCVKGMNADGHNRNIEIPLLSKSALIISKCRSVEGVKRQRDSFDIFYLLAGEDGQQLAEELLELAANELAAKMQLRKFSEWLQIEGCPFDANVQHYAQKPVASPSMFVLRLLDGV